jgi:UV DNA damage endonuclease
MKTDLNFKFPGKIGYVAINHSIDCRASRTFRLKSYSPEKLKETVGNNLNCLKEILEFNVQNKIFYFRISSDTIPFASHPVMDFDWKDYFQDDLHIIGEIIKKHVMRVCMHPDQFILLNSSREDVFHRSVAELNYHADLLDLLGTDESHKIQLHVGGVYGDKEESIKRFISRYRGLNPSIRERLVIENDDRSYSAQDCIYIAEKTGIPVVFDVFHHQLNNNGEKWEEILQKVSNTWQIKDGRPMVDFSTQDPDKRPGAHAKTLDPDLFIQFLQKTEGIPFDIMLEIKDKEKSALKALKIAGLD